MKYLLLALFLSTAHAEEKPVGEKQTFTQGNDSYNFYFQKAPGPTTVNQGTAPAASAVNSTTAAPTPAAVAEATPMDFHSWEASVGVTAPILQNLFSANNPTPATGKLSQFAFGVQYNSSSLLGISGEFFGLNPLKEKNPEYSYYEVSTARSRFALGFSLTPFRGRFSRDVGASLSAAAGYLNIIRAFSYGGGDSKNTGYFGARLALSFGRNIGLNLMARRVIALDGVQGLISAAWLF